MKMFSFVRSRTLFTRTVSDMPTATCNRFRVLSGEQKRLNKCTWILRFMLYGIGKQL